MILSWSSVIWKLSPSYRKKLSIEVTGSPSRTIMSNRRVDQFQFAGLMNGGFDPMNFWWNILSLHMFSLSSHVMMRFPSHTHQWRRNILVGLSAAVCPIDCRPGFWFENQSFRLLVLARCVSHLLLRRVILFTGDGRVVPNRIEYIWRTWIGCVLTIEAVNYDIILPHCIIHLLNHKHGSSEPVL